MRARRTDTIKVCAKCNGSCCWLGERCPECHGSGLLRITDYATEPVPLQPKKHYGWHESEWKKDSRTIQDDAAIERVVGED